MISNAAKNFDILATNLSVLHNYFDSLIKLFSVSIVKFFNTSAKPSKKISYMIRRNR